MPFKEFRREFAHGARWPAVALKPAGLALVAAMMCLPAAAHEGQAEPVPENRVDVFFSTWTHAMPDLERVDPAYPPVAALEALSGTYTSKDADAFGSDLGTIIFRRDGEWQVHKFSVVQERVWDLRFQRTN